MNQKLIRNESEKDHEWIWKGFGIDQDASGKDHEWIRNGSGMDQEWTRNGSKIYWNWIRKISEMDQDMDQELIRNG